MPQYLQDLSSSDQKLNVGHSSGSLESLPLDHQGTPKMLSFKWENSLQQKHAFFFFWLHCTVYGVLVSRQGMESMPLAVEAQNFNH